MKARAQRRVTEKPNPALCPSLHYPRPLLTKAKRVVADISSETNSGFFPTLELRVGEVAQTVQHFEVIARVVLHRVPEGIVAVFHDGVEHLEAGHDEAGAVNGPQVDLSQLAEEIGGEFGFAFGLFNGLAVLQVILVTALNPFGQT